MALTQKTYKKYWKWPDLALRHNCVRLRMFMMTLQRVACEMVCISVRMRSSDLLIVVGTVV